MKSKYTYKSDESNLLLNLALKGLKEKIDDTLKLEKYANDLRKEILILEAIKFDGYMLLLNDMVKTSQEMGIFVSCFGSIQNSLTAYALGIVDNYEFKGFQHFINFTPFEKKPTVNIVATSARYGEIIAYVEYKYDDLIKNSKNKSIKFNDNLKIKFIDLGIERELRLDKKDVENLGLEIVDPDINFSNMQASFLEHNKLQLGLEALHIGDVLVERIIDEREDSSSFKNFDDLLERVPLLANVDASILEKLSENRAFKIEA